MSRKESTHRRLAGFGALHRLGVLYAEISFHGAAQTVTGSQHLITVDGKGFLLDCGLYQGKREEARTSEPGVSSLMPPALMPWCCLTPASITRVIIPNLVKQGFRGKIICTTATADLCGAMLLDSGHIQEEDVEYVNRQRRKYGEPPVRADLHPGRARLRR